MPKRQRRTAQRHFECLQSEVGYTGSYDRVHKYIKRWKDRQKASTKVTQAFVPLFDVVAKVMASAQRSGIGKLSFVTTQQ